MSSNIFLLGFVIGSAEAMSTMAIKTMAGLGYALTKTMIIASWNGIRSFFNCDDDLKPGENEELVTEEELEKLISKNNTVIPTIMVINRPYPVLYSDLSRTNIDFSNSCPSVPRFLPIPVNPPHPIIAASNIPPFPPKLTRSNTIKSISTISIDDLETESFPDLELGLVMKSLVAQCEDLKSEHGESIISDGIEVESQYLSDIFSVYSWDSDSTFDAMELKKEHYQNSIEEEEEITPEPETKRWFWW